MRMLENIMNSRLSSSLLLVLFVSVGMPFGVLGESFRFSVTDNNRVRVAQHLGSDHFFKNQWQSQTHVNQETDPKEIFLQVIDMINHFYVSDVSMRFLWKSVWQRLQFTMLPKCLEEVHSFGDCQGSTEKCFLDSIEDLCQACHVNCAHLLNEATKFLVKELDANSSLLDQGMLNELKISTSGKFGGVGMVVSSRENGYVVVSALDGSPAQRAGIKAGDTILEIDGHPLHGVPLLNVLSMVRGPSGSAMTILVESARNNKLRRLKMRRQVIRIAPVRSITLSQNVGYIRIVNFQEDTSRELVRVLSRLTSHSTRYLRGIIIDVRDNPGGLLEEAIKTAGLLKTKGKLTSLKGRSPDVTREFYSTLDRPLYEGPIALLANRGSASGSEILVGALQGMPNVRVIGERTFGKASVQAVFSLTRTLAIRLTTAHYYTADGRDIEGKGIDPDVFLGANSGHLAPKVGALNAADIESDPLVKVALDYLLDGRLPRRSPFPSLL